MGKRVPIQSEDVADGHASRCPLRILFAALLPAILGIVPVWRWIAGQMSQPPSWKIGDIDTVLIREGLFSAPRFVDTLQWWVGTWVGQVPFYRPLTSYVFWLEWRAFGDLEHLYTIPTFLAHLAATAALAVLAYRLALTWALPHPQVMAIAAGWAFAGFGMDYRSTVVERVVLYWKNQPDTLAALCTFLAVQAYLHARNRRDASPLQAVCWYLAACCFKEIAVPLPLACAILEADRRLGDVPRGRHTRVLSMMAAAVLFFALRWVAIGGLGYRYGSNDAWLFRTSFELFGPLALPLMYGYWIVPALALLTAVVALGWRTMSAVAGERPSRARRLRANAAAIAAFTVGTIALGQAHLRQMDALDAVYSWQDLVAQTLMLWVDPRISLGVASTLATLGALRLCWRRSQTLVCFCLGWTLLFLAPLTLSPGPSHRYYLPQAGYFLLGGAALGCFADWVSQRWTDVRKSQRGNRRSETCPEAQNS